MLLGVRHSGAGGLEANAAPVPEILRLAACGELLAGQVLQREQVRRIAWTVHFAFCQTLQHCQMLSKEAIRLVFGCIGTDFTQEYVRCFSSSSFFFTDYLRDDRGKRHPLNFGTVQTHLNLVDVEKCCNMNL